MGKKPLSSRKPVNAVYADDDYMVFEKPPGLLTIAGDGESGVSLTEIVNDQHAQAGGASLHPCHRLDRETSGLIIFAKGKSRQQKMMAVFHENAVYKRYIAFVQGRPEKDHGELRKSIRKPARDKFSAGGPGKPAVTKFRVVARHKDFSVLEVEPQTGRTNQIRIHLAGYGHPIVGERRFAFAKDFTVKFKRVALHAAGLKFTQPVTGKVIELNSPLPEDMSQFLAQHPIKGAKGARNFK